MSVAIIIPSRYASTRLPGKSMADLNGKPLFMWVYDACKKVKNASDVVVATDHELIFKHGKAQNAKILMTSDSHQSGTDRCAEVAEKLDVEYVINVQGDEPFIKPQLIEEMIQHLQMQQDIQILTLFHKFKANTDVADPSKVKLVKSKNGEILYFSRSSIPFQRSSKIPVYFKHIGIYAFKRSVLLEVSKLDQGALEESEGLEQLRWLEHGYRIHGLETKEAPLGIDTPEDLEQARIFARNHY